jgi:hypothetical protein
MGVSHSGAEAAAKMQRLGMSLVNVQLDQVNEASRIVKASVMARAPSRLRGVGKRGARLGVRYRSGMYGGEAKSIVFVTGPWQLIEWDTKAHRIPRARKSRRARKRYAVIPGVGVRAYAEHPGTRGKHPWRTGVTAAIPAVQRVFESRVGFLVRQAFA